MRIENKTIKPRKSTGSVGEALKALKPGQVIRFTTAAEMYSSQGSVTTWGKKRNIKFARRIDGDDVLIYIKP